MSKVVRSVKNVTKGYSSVQVKVRNATSNDAWGPTGTDMAEIAALTFNNHGDFYEIMDMLDKRLNDKGKNWRHVLKSLKVLDYCLHEGSEMVVTWARKNVYIIKTLREFQYIDEDGADVGQNVRVAAKELTSLLLDEDRLRSERSDRKLWKSRVSGLEDGMQGMGHEPPRSRRQRPPRTEEEDVEYKLAIEASKHEAEEERRRREQGTKIEGEDDDLAKAIRLSKEEEELRRRELEQSNAASLFGDATPTTQPQPTGFNQGYQQQGAVDWFGNPLDAQKPMSTGMLNNVYSQPTGFQPQPTGFANGYGFQQQPTGFDQSQFQQPQQQQQNTYLQAQPQPLQQRQTAFTNNPYGNDIFGMQQPQQPQQTQQPQQPQQPQQQQQNFLQPGSHNPWAGNNQQPMESLKPMPTGSNNPFATGFNIQRPQTANGPPSLSTLAEQKTATQFNTSQTSTNPILGYQASPQPQMPQMPQQPYKAQDPHRAQLNSLLATGEGQDTFGNVGDLRIPAQHTAPGVFVNSAGQGLGRMQPNPTANNPFLNHHLTGLPNNQPNNNPFGAAGAPQGQSQGGSLIDL